MPKRGSISKIYLKDFVTYSEITVTPGQNLNFVIGPNGSGKSTIIAGIILGLGGNPKMIGRGSKISDYIRHSCHEAKVTITLHDKNNKTVAISRIFNMKNYNTWYLNDKSVVFSEIDKVTKAFDIQVTNLCQFLPQDRVQDFAKMNNKELLHNTQKALGRDDLLKLHNELLEMQNKHNNSSSDKTLLLNKIEQLEKNISRLESKVQNFESKKKLIEDIHHIERKISWQKYEQLLNKKNKVEHDWNKSKDIVEKHKKRIQPLQNKINEMKNRSSTLHTALLEIKDEMATCKNNISDSLKKIESLMFSETEILNEKHLKLDEIHNKQNEIKEIKRKINKLINDEKALFEKHGQIQDINDKLKKMETLYSTCTQKCNEIHMDRCRQMSILKGYENNIRNLEYKLARMENLKNTRLEVLKKCDNDAYKAVLWLRENKHLFQGKVYEPMILELDIKDRKFSKYFENIISWKDRFAFTCELREDMNIMLRNVRDEQKLAVNVLHSGQEHPPTSHYVPHIPIEQLRKYGLYVYANDLITGPEAILKFLCRMYAIHCIPIGDKSTYDKATLVPSEIRLFFSETHRFAVSTSRYTGEKSTRISEIEANGTFSICINQTETNQIKQELNKTAQEKDAVQSEIDVVLRQNEVLLEKQKQIVAEIKGEKQILESINSLKTNLTLSYRKLEKIESTVTSTDEVEKTVKNKMKDVLERCLDMHKLLLKLQESYQVYIDKEQLIHIERELIQNKITCLENEKEDFKREYENALQVFQQIDELYTSAVRDVSRALHETKQLSNGCTPKDKDFNVFRVEFNSLPNDTVKLENILHEIKTKIECMSIADASEIQTYENDRKQLKRLQSELQDKEKYIANFQKDFQKLYLQWIMPLKELVSQINDKFGNYFMMMECAGEIQISSASEMDFESYGLSIRVTFRATQDLQELNQHVQSGGERAVTTAIYMLSMQDLLTVPFRCIDEINQGMDPQNERKIFKILVDVTSKPSSCQYFLVTPKLVKGLEFGKGVLVCVIYNGPFVQPRRDENNV